MDEQRPPTAYSAQTNNTSDALNIPDANAPVSSFASIVGQQPPLEDLEVHVQNGVPVVPQAAVSYSQITKRGISFSGRKAVVISACITLLVTMLTGASILFITKNAPKGKTANKTNVAPQDVALKNAASSQLPEELQGNADSLLVNGDIITRGQLKFSNGGYVTVLKPGNLTSNQSFTLPSASGTLCLDSNNCAYAAASDLQQLRNELGQIVFPTIPASVLSLNGQAGVIGIQGSVHRISVNTSNGLLTLSTPQDLDTNSNVQFGSLGLTGTGTITANGIAFTLPNTGAASQMICTTGITCASGGGLAVILGPTAVQTDASADASIFINDTGGGNLIQIRSGGVDQLVVANDGDTAINGSLTINGFSAGFVRSNGSGLLSVVSAINLNSSDVSNVLAVTNGGTGANTLAAGGVVVGNGAAAVTSVTASGAGQCLISTGGNPSFQTCPGSTSGVDSINALNGAVLLQGTTNQISVNTGVGTITLSTPQNIDNTAAPTFAGLTLSGLNGGGVVKAANGTGILSAGPVALGSEVSGTLPVTNGGTGAGSLTLNGVIIGNGTGALSSIAAGAPGQCLISTAGAPSFSACPGGGSGAPDDAEYLTLSNNGSLSNERAFTAGTNLSFDDQGANSTLTISVIDNPNFATSVTTPLLQSAGALSITAGGTLSIGVTNQALVLQGNASTTLAASASGNITTVGFAVPTGNRTISFPDESGTVCLVGSPSCGFAGGGSGVTLLNSLSGALTVANSSGLGATITINDASTAAKGIAQFNSTNFSAASGTINTIQGISNAATPLFAGLTLTGNLTLGTANEIHANILRHTAGGQDIAIDANGDDIIFSANGQSFVFPSSGGAMQTICTSGISCVAGGGQAVILEPGAVQTASSNDTAIFIDKASGSGNLIQLQTGGIDKFVINNSGAITLDNATVSNTLTTNTITPTGALTIGATGQSFTLQGNGSSALTATGGGFLTSVGFNIGSGGTAPTGNVTYRFLNDNTVTPGTYDVCTTAGNCTGVGGSITGSGTPGAIPKFSSASAITDSIISENAGVITIGGALSVTSANGITAGNPSTTNGVLRLANSTNANLITLQSGGTGTATINVPAASGTIAVSASGPLVLDPVTGDLTCPTCLSSGGGGPGGVTSLDGLTGVLTINNATGVGSVITIDDATTAAKGIASFNSTNFSVTSGAVNTVQNINSTASPTFNNLTLQGTTGLSVGSTSNLGKVSFLDGTNDGFTTTFQPATLTVSSKTITIPNASGTLAVSASGNVQLSVAGNITTINNPSFSTSVTTPSLQSSGALNVGTTSAGTVTVGATGQRLALQGSATTTLAATNSGNTTTVGFVTPTGANAINFPNAGGTVAVSASGPLGLDALGNLTCTTCLTGGTGGSGGVSSITGASGGSAISGAITLSNASGTSQTLTIDNATTAAKGIASFSSSFFTVSSGAVSIANSAITNTQIADSTIQNVKLANSSVTVTGGTGLSGGGTVSLGASATPLTVNYGATSSSAVRGDTVLNCPSGTGNLSGGGTAITLGSGGTCGALNTIASPTFTGTLTVQGASTTVGQSGTQGSLILYDGGVGGASHAATLQAISTLAQATTYTLPDPTGATATICINTGNCAGSGTGVTQSGSNASGQIPYFTSSNNITSSTAFMWNGTSTLTFAQNSTITAGANTLALTASSVNATSGVVAIGTASTSAGAITLYNTSNGNSITVRTGATSGTYNFVLPTSAGNSGDCLTNTGTPGTLIFQSCSAGLNLQTAYTASTGGTTSEIIVDATRAALDIQDRSTTNGGTIAGNLLNVRATAATDATAGALLFGIGNTGATVFQNTTNSATAFRILTSGSGALFVADTLNNSNNGRILIGGASPTLANASLAVTVAEVTSRLLIGTTSNGIDTNSGKAVYTGTYRNDKAVTLRPEFDGLTLNGSGVGVLTSGFCSNVAGGLTVNSSLCASTTSHSYYNWTSAETGTQSYDMYVRYKLPSDFDGFASDSTITLSARRDTSTDIVTFQVYQANGTLCGSGNTTVTTSDDTWQTVQSNGSETSCTFAAGDTITFKITVTSEDATTGAYVGELDFTYKSKF